MVEHALQPTRQQDDRGLPSSHGRAARLGGFLKLDQASLGTRPGGFPKSPEIGVVSAGRGRMEAPSGSEGERARLTKVRSLIGPEGPNRRTTSVMDACSFVAMCRGWVAVAVDVTIRVAWPKPPAEPPPMPKTTRRATSASRQRGAPIAGVQEEVPPVDIPADPPTVEEPGCSFAPTGRALRLAAFL